ncbi:hypothetical protein, partial [Cellulomonas triticagri]
MGQRVRRGVGEVVAARLGAVGEFAPPPEVVEDEAARFLREKHGAEFEVTVVERAGFSGPTDVLSARRCDGTGEEIAVHRFAADGRYE